MAVLHSSGRPLFIEIQLGSLLMQRYKMARWRLILRRGTFHSSLIRNIRRLRHSRWRAARFCSTVLLTIAWLVLPLIPGCGHRTQTSSSLPVPPDARPAVPPPKSPPRIPVTATPSGRSINVRGLDNEYRGTTRILPDKQLIHQKD